MSQNDRRRKSRQHANFVFSMPLTPPLPAAFNAASALTGRVTMFGSFATEMRCPRHVRFALDRDRTMDNAGRLKSVESRRGAVALG